MWATMTSSTPADLELLHMVEGLRGAVGPVGGVEDPPEGVPAEGLAGFLVGAVRAGVFRDVHRRPAVADDFVRDRADKHFVEKSFSFPACNDERNVLFFRHAQDFLIRDPELYPFFYFHAGRFDQRRRLVHPVAQEISQCFCKFQDVFLVRLRELSGVDDMKQDDFLRPCFFQAQRAGKDILIKLLKGGDIKDLPVHIPPFGYPTSQP